MPAKNKNQLPELPFQKKHPSELNKNDSYFMQHAYNEAINAWKENEVPVGAIIVVDNRIIASDHNRVEQTKDATAHAEILTIAQACGALKDWRLNKTTLYVTKEPCPMCAGAAIMARVGRLVFACSDPKMGCLGGCTSLHTTPSFNHKLQISNGILREECEALLKAFFKSKRLEKEDTYSFIKNLAT